MATAKPGPKPQPTNVVELRGNPGKRKRLPEISPTDGSLKPPAGLTEIAAKFWKAYAPEVSRLGMLTQLDRPTFEMLAEAYAAVHMAKQALRGRAKNIVVTMTDRAHGREQRKHPAWQIYRDAVTQYLSLAREFGFSPSSRVNLPAVGDDGDADDEIFE